MVAVVAAVGTAIHGKVGDREEPAAADVAVGKICCCSVLVGLFAGW